MHIVINTKVDGYYKNVMKAFDLKLFEFLQPKGAKTQIVDFTGSSKGDKVHIRFLSPIKADWISEIIDDNITDDKAYFIDQGTIMPWPLKKWNHKHIVIKASDSTSIIKDDISYKTSNYLLDFLIYPVMYFTFLQRKPLYQKYFNNTI